MNTRHASGLRFRACYGAAPALVGSYQGPGFRHSLVLGAVGPTRSFARFE